MQTDPSLILLPEGLRVPKAVQQCLDDAQALGIGFRVSRNAYATTCSDAAAKRVRDGILGIPLHDELNTFLGSWHGNQGQGVVMAHCRGDQSFDWGKLRRAL